MHLVCPVMLQIGLSESHKAVTTYWVDGSHPTDYSVVPADAAARAAAGSASRIRSIAASSCAAEMNHDSNTDGGSETPELSIEWKNGGYLKVSCAATSS